MTLKIYSFRKHPGNRLLFQLLIIDISQVLHLNIITQYGNKKTNTDTL